VSERDEKKGHKISIEKLFENLIKKSLNNRWNLLNFLSLFIEYFVVVKKNLAVQREKFLVRKNPRLNGHKIDHP
jgi:hypothetical protein